MKKFRDSIFSAWNHECAYCGRPANTLDHVRPKSKGGGLVTYNLVPACERCNRNKSDHPHLEWFRRQEFWEKEREEMLMDWICSNSQLLDDLYEVEEIEMEIQSNPYL